MCDGKTSADAGAENLSNVALDKTDEENCLDLVDLLGH